MREQHTDMTEVKIATAARARRMSLRIVIRVGRNETKGLVLTLR